MKVAEMLHTPIVTCSPDRRIADVALTMAREGVGSVVVVEEHGDIAGIITDRDLVVDAMAHELSPETPIRVVMKAGVISVPADADVFDAAEMMAKARCRRLPVIDDRGYPVGMVTLDDLVVLLAHESDHLAETVEAETMRPQRA